MKKIILMFSLLMSVAMTSFAQQTTVEGSKFFDNTYVGATIGGQLGMHDFTGHNNWTVAPDLNIYLGKWVTPVIGFEVNAEMIMHDGFSSRNTFVDGLYTGVGVKGNLNNMFHHYRGVADRVEVMPFASIGLLHAFGDGVQGTHGNMPLNQMCGLNTLATKFGIDLGVNLGKTRAWAINVRPSVCYALSGNAVGDARPRFNSNLGRVNLEVGMTYRFGHKNSKGQKIHNFQKAYTAAEYDALVEKLANVKPDTVEVPVEIIKTITITEKSTAQVAKQVAVVNPHFEFGKYTVDKTSESALDNLAQEMKSNNASYQISGYASTEGSDDYNQILSYNRANAIKNALVQRGVNASRLTAVGCGSTNKFGSTPANNRCVVVSEK